MKQIAVLGSTGSIGTNCLDVVHAHSDRLKCVAIVANRKWEVLADQASRHRPRWVIVNDENLRTSIPQGSFPRETELLFGSAAIERVASDPEVEIQVGTKKMKAHARTTTGAERARPSIAGWNWNASTPSASCCFQATARPSC